MISLLDCHGQPANDLFNAQRRADRAVHEMLGLIKGVLVDGVVSDAEVLAFRDWFAANPDALTVWPGYRLSARIRAILADGRVDDAEREDLRLLFQATAGVQLVEEANASTTLAFDDPSPVLNFEGSTYLFTGRLVYGTRSHCEQAVRSRGASVVSRLNSDVNVLVVGCIGSRDWIHSSFGRKIEAAVKLRRSGSGIVIVPESHWVTSIET